MITFAVGTPLRCNRCNARFDTPKPVNGNDCGDGRAVIGERAEIRLDDFTTCPHCGQVDTQWVYSRDLPKEVAQA